MRRFIKYPFTVPFPWPDDNQPDGVPISAKHPPSFRVEYENEPHFMEIPPDVAESVPPGWDDEPLNKHQYEELQLKYRITWKGYDPSKDPKLAAKAEGEGKGEGGEDTQEEAEAEE